MTEVHNLGSLLQSLCEGTEGEKVTVGSLLDTVGRRSYGPVLLMLGFVSISPLTIIPGANWLIALVTFIFALQIVVGWRRPWIPDRLLRFEFPRKYLTQAVSASEKYVSMIDAFLKPRLTFLTDPPFVQLIALVCVAAALITFPLGFFPFGPLLPGLTVLFLGLGLAARDGFMLIIAGLALAGACYVTIRVWNALPFT